MSITMVMEELQYIVASPGCIRLSELGSEDLYRINMVRDAVKTCPIIAATVEDILRDHLSSDHVSTGIGSIYATAKAQLKTAVLRPVDTDSHVFLYTDEWTIPHHQSNVSGSSRALIYMAEFDHRTIKRSHRSLLETAGVRFVKMMVPVDGSFIGLTEDYVDVNNVTVEDSHTNEDMMLIAGFFLMFAVYIMSCRVDSERRVETVRR